jgi:ADP-ribosyl-[dinitrogen reductase] hydrolase
MGDRLAQIEGGLIGLLVGDALGVPYEFHGAEALPPWTDLEMVPPPSFPRAHAGVPPGTWSDDGAQALCLLATLLQKGQCDPDDLSRRLINWLEWGYMAVDDRVFDVGNQTRKAIAALSSGSAPLEAGPAGEMDNGNGSLMRVLPLALWHRGTDAALARDASLQSRITHGHPHAQACCALYVLWARRILDGVNAPWDAAVETFRSLSEPGTPQRQSLEQVILPAFDLPLRGDGYVVHSLRAAVTLNARGSYEDVVRGAIALGDDTDTTACIAGGIAGLRFGVDGIPGRWRGLLRGRSLFNPLLENLLASAS